MSSEKSQAAQEPTTESLFDQQNRDIHHLLADFQSARTGLSEAIIGQSELVDRLIIALLCDGHLLVEGAPGLAKTRAVKALAELVDAEFHRIQFTPDLLPADLTGSDIYRPQTGEFSFQPGPIFHNIVLADEINRAPAKVQSALLESMAERQVTIGRTTHPLPDLFMVMATQNPIEQEGTYPLPEAQLDRFFMHVTVDYPSVESEAQILKLARKEAMSDLERARLDRLPSDPDTRLGTPPQSNRHLSRPPLDTKRVMNARRAVFDVHLSDAMAHYIVELIAATRNPSPYGRDLADFIEFGASPRGSIALERAARANAWLAGRETCHHRQKKDALARRLYQSRPPRRLRLLFWGRYRPKPPSRLKIQANYRSWGQTFGYVECLKRHQSSAIERLLVVCPPQPSH